MRRISRHWADYLYVLPALLVMLLVIGYPLVYTVWLSFHATPPRTGEWVFNGTQNYQDILSDPRFWRIDDEHDLLDRRIDALRLHPRLRRGAGAAQSVPGPGRGAGSASDPLGHFGCRGRVCLAVDPA